MDKDTERRREQRLRYHWPVWFAENISETVSQGQMVDVSSEGAAFTCHADENCPYPGQQVTTRFSVPCFGPEDSFDIANFTRISRICRVDNVNSFLRCVAVQFTDPLPFKPGEQAGSKSDTQQRPEAVAV